MVLGSLATVGVAALTVRDVLRVGFESGLLANLIVGSLCAAGAFAGASLKRGTKWARGTIGVVAGLLALNFSLFGLWAWSLHSSAPQATSTSSYPLFVILPLGVGILVYSAAVATLAGRRRLT